MTTSNDVPVTFTSCEQVPGPYAHGTRAVLAVGDDLVPGRQSDFQAACTSHHTCFTAVLETAVWDAELAAVLSG